MQFDRLKRREFVSLLGGAAAAWPVAAHAQQPAMPVIGFLTQAADEDQLRGFQQGLKEAGFVEGENVSILYRSAENEIDRLPALAVDLARRRVAVIATQGNAAAVAAKNATAIIPILFTVGEDPVRLGLVASLARPGGNLTGVNIFATELVAKRLALMRDLIPTAARVAVLVDPASKTVAELTLQGVESAARALTPQIQVLNASNGPEIGSAFAAFERERPDALFVSIGPLIYCPARATCHFGGTPHDAHDIRQSSNYPSRWIDELRNQYYGCVSSSGRLRRPHPQGRETC